MGTRPIERPTEHEQQTDQQNPSPVCPGVMFDTFDYFIVSAGTTKVRVSTCRRNLVLFYGKRKNLQTRKYVEFKYQEGADWPSLIR